MKPLSLISSSFWHEMLSPSVSCKNEFAIRPCPFKSVLLKLSAVSFELALFLASFRFELGPALSHFFIIPDAGGLIRACPWHDIPTVLQFTKSQGKAFHLVFPETIY
jgi:hypothetical protein